MHDYTASQLHEGRMRELTRDADAYRLAATAKAGRERKQRDPRPRTDRGLSFATVRVWLQARRSPRPARS